MLLIFGVRASQKFYIKNNPQRKEKRAVYLLSTFKLILGSIFANVNIVVYYIVEGRKFSL